MSIALQAPPGFFLAKEKDLKGLYKRRKELEQAFAKGKATEQRADALVMAYYVLQHMAELALKVYSSLGKESPSFAPARAYVVSVLDILEKEKGMAEKLEPDDDARQARCVDFALRVFQLADDKDRGGTAYSASGDSWKVQSKKVAQLFWQAQQFLSVLRQFSKGDGSAGSEAELPGDLQEKYVYAKWKTADIISHVKRGERPAPGPPGGDDGGSGGSENEGGMAGEGKMAATGEDEGKSTGSMSLGGGSSGGDGGGAWDLPPPPAMTPHASSEGSSSGTGGSLRGGGGGGGGLNMPGAADAPPAYPSVSAGSTAPATANVNGDRKPASEPMNILSYAASGDGGKVDADVARLLAGAKGKEDALELSRFAVRSLEEDSAGEARQYLMAALRCLS